MVNHWFLCGSFAGVNQPPVWGRRTMPTTSTSPSSCPAARRAGYFRSGGTQPRFTITGGWSARTSGVTT
jgi:hypothetical protein